MAEGYIAHYHCDICGYDFESQSSKVILNSVKLDKIPHKAGSSYYHDGDNHWNLCIYKCGIKLNITQHSFTEKNMSSEYKVSDKNCTQPDIYYYSCICSLKGTEKFTDGDPLGHNITVHQAETEATCTKPGYHEYWYCNRCKLYFTDEKLTASETLENLTKPTTGHDWQYKYDDHEHWRECSRCHLEEDGSKGEHVWKYDVFNRQFCEICAFYPATGQGGFDVTIQDKTPLGHLDFEREGDHVKVSFVDDNSDFPPTRIIWYLNDTAMLDSEFRKDITGFYEIEFNMSLSILYRVRCEYSNEYGIRSESISLRK